VAGGAVGTARSPALDRRCTLGLIQGRRPWHRSQRDLFTVATAEVTPVAEAALLRNAVVGSCQTPA
jgi:hypothetical protein